MPSNAELIDTLTAKVSALFNGANSSELKEDMQRNLKALIQSSFSKLDVVSRDEFDAQVAVLQRTRQKIEALEHQLAELSKQVAP
ncbi:MAG: accessory factor UbiK family protein [Spongiibacteraceae bacterium]